MALSSWQRHGSWTTSPWDAERAERQARRRAAATAAATTAAAATSKAAATTAAKTTTAAATTTKSAPSSSSAKPASGSTSDINGNRSGLSWASGVFNTGDGAGSAAAFGDWRGRKVDVVVDWAARSSWDDVVNPDWLYAKWKGTPYLTSLGIAPIPENAGATLGACASGSYNDKWREFARNIKAAGMDDSIIRLGWEFNGDWYVWSANNPGQFAECWRQIVGTVEGIAPGLRWDWSVNRGRGQSVANPAQAYPGDSYVDIVGVDSYDQWPGATSASGWSEQYAGAYGLKHWLNFARDHGKKLSVPEWGVYPGTANGGNNGGDNPYYISKMFGFFREAGGTLAYESYFNESAGYYAGAIFSPNQNPKAAAEYKSQVS
jgi:hypothetical protein